MPSGPSPSTLFSPVRRVNFNVNNARVGQRTDYDHGIEVWTDGMAPADAVAYGAKILKEQVQIFINFDEEAEPEYEEETVENEILQNENLYRSVDELELSVQSANCFRMRISSSSVNSYKNRSRDAQDKEFWSKVSSRDQRYSRGYGAFHGYGTRRLEPDARQGK